MLGRLIARARGPVPMSGGGSNETTKVSIYDWAKMWAPGAQVSYGGQSYQAYKTSGGGQAPGAAFYSSNPIVFSCVATRMLLFSEGRFQFQRMRNGRPGDFFGSAELSILEEPWAGHSTRDFLAQVELDVAAAGNSYWIRTPDDFLQRIDASYVKIITIAATDQVMTGQRIGEKLGGYAVYFPGNKEPVLYEPGDIVHHKPYPDINNRFIGMSWLSPCLADVSADAAITDHKETGVQNGAQLNYVVSFDQSVNKEQFDAFVGVFRRDHEGPENAGKTLFLGGGADVKTVGQTFEQLGVTAVQAAGETRIAACAGVPPTILGFAEGLKGSSLNAGNYGQARRRLVDGTMRPLWGFLSSALSSVVNVPVDARLAIDDRDIPFLREDLTDVANILTLDSSTLGSLIQAGFDADAAVDAVLNNDLSRLSGKHTGLTSVQLQPPSDGVPKPPTDTKSPGGDSPPASNGNGKKPAPSLK